MIFGEYGQGGRELPCVVKISIARYSRELPMENDLLPFLVSIHVEGTGLTWQQNVSLDYETERQLLDKTQALYRWSLDMDLTRNSALDHIRDIGEKLFETFIGTEGKKVISSLNPTAILLDIDETIQNLPWELLGENNQPLSLQHPLGRLVRTRVIPKPNRDPLQEDRDVRILAVINPTQDLVVGTKEKDALKLLEGRNWGRYRILVEVLEGNQATKASFLDLVKDGRFDIIHFSGHGAFSPNTPERSDIHFSDGPLTADEILNMDWTAPPYLVFSSACESGRAAGGKRLVSNDSHSNGIACAFIAAGVSGYAGFYWPVKEDGAAYFTETFFKTMFERENVGIALLKARKEVKTLLEDYVDLTAYSAVFYGDTASSHRPELTLT